MNKHESTLSKQEKKGYYLEFQHFAHNKPAIYI